MPTIALSMSLLYSAFVILGDCLRRKNVSFAIWVPTIFVMILSSRPASLWMSGGTVHLGVEMANDQAGNMVDQLFFLGMICGSFAIASMHGYQWKKLLTMNNGIMLFYLYFAISVCWSSDPSGSVKRIVKDFGLLFVGAVVLSEKDPLQAMRAMFLRSAALLFPLSVVFIKYYPQLGRAYDIAGGMMMTGVTTQKNSLGEIVLIFSMFMVWDIMEIFPRGTKFKISRIPWNTVLLLLIGAWLLDLSQSKTALLCIMICVALILRPDRFLSGFFNRTALIGAMSLPFLVFFSQQFSSVIAPIIESLGRNMTFTGRTEIWQHITLKTVNPLIGAGYWNFWGGPGGYAVNREMNSIIPNAHNGYVDLYLDGGIIGLTVLFIMLVFCGRQIMKCLKIHDDLTRYHKVRFAVLIAAIIYNLSESTFARMGPIWFTTLLMIVNYPPVIKAAKNAREALQKRKRPTNNFQSPAFANN